MHIVVWVFNPRRMETEHQSDVYKDSCVEWYNEGTLSFERVTSVNLDEYKGITKDNDQSYYYFMNDNLFQYIDINKERTFLPDGTEPDSEKACAAYNEIIHSVGGIDLQLLGLGHNGHIGFNEPADHFSLETNCVDLQESTINANKSFFLLMMMFQSRRILWESRLLCRQRRYWS